MSEFFIYSVITLILFGIFLFFSKYRLKKKIVNLLDSSPSQNYLAYRTKRSIKGSPRKR